jgi:hypothetical protein
MLGDLNHNTGQILRQAMPKLVGAQRGGTHVDRQIAAGRVIPARERRFDGACFELDSEATPVRLREPDVRRSPVLIEWKPCEGFI